MKSKIIVTMVVVILGAWLLPGCKLFTQDISLPGTYWTLEALNSHDLLPDSAISAGFKAGEAIPLYIFGRAGCNDYSSPVELDEERSGTLHPTDVRVATNRSCLSPGLLDQEGEYLAALRSVRAYEISKSRLAMKNQAGQVVLEFRRDTPSEVDALAGTRWNLETLNGHAMISDSRITATFSENGPGGMGGSAGCNSYGMLFELVDSQIVRLRFLNIVGLVTDDYCVGPVEGVMEQEREYLETLRSVMTYEISDGRSNCQDLDEIRGESAHEVKTDIHHGARVVSNLAADGLQALHRRGIPAGDVLDARVAQWPGSGPGQQDHGGVQNRGHDPAVRLW
jgi:heat shock protein HslJ